jgi:prevent-host-death family protein
VKTMAISEFKAQALKVLNEISKNRETIIITKRGKPIARVAPHSEPEIELTPGKLKDAFVFEKDIVTPLGEERWEACK